MPRFIRVQGVLLQLVKQSYRQVYKYLMTGVSCFLWWWREWLCIALFFARYPCFNEPGTLAAALFQIGVRRPCADGAGTGWVYCLLQLPIARVRASPAYWRMLASLCGAPVSRRDCGRLSGRLQRTALAQNIKLPASRKRVAVSAKYCSMVTGLNTILRGGWSAFLR